MKVFELGKSEFVRVSGPDMMTFLQGQITCNMDKLSATNSLSGALCNLKGRVIGDFRVVLDGEDCLLLTSSGMAEVIIGTLAKYAVFSKVELTKDEKIIGRLGFLGDDTPEHLAQSFNPIPEHPGDCASSSSGICIRLPGTEARFELWYKDESLHSALTANSTLPGNTEQWHREDILAGIVHIDPAKSEQYTPQLLNYDISGVIDFEKGCYTGQEVVARMFYRGTPKKRLYLLTSNQPILAESELLELNGETPAGADVVAFSNTSPNTSGPHLLLAILDTKAVDSDAKFVLSNDLESCLQIQRLSYS
ncbi:MAG: hypothetical protein OXU66_05105 [Gammaproteobacteria bacterium]|nr:hypothetical protein [Gammaproteobacteria bacterium]MDD9896444.1 hypothetical protein [Gammaproteobacteria bacterium]MDD9958300.1 hypothetical protein [Gammaproteobacteria bacterium]